jgi:hypothetical protein
MKTTFILSAAAAGALVFAAAHEAAAQAQQPRSPSPATPVELTLPPGGLTFNFGDIDRNGDNVISVEEWNAFVQSLSARAAGKAPGSAAAGGTTPPPQPERR